MTYFLAATQLNPRSLYQIVNPPLDPVSIEASLRAKNLSDQVPLLQRYWTWLTDIVLHWDWGQAPKGGNVGAEVSRRIWVSLRLITIGSLLGTVIGVGLGAWTATRQYKFSDRAATFGSLFILSVPSFVIASVLQVLATKFNNATGLRVFEFVGETGSHGNYFGAASGRPDPAPGASHHRPDPDQRRVLQPNPAQPDAGRPGLGLRPDGPGQGTAPARGRS